MFCLVKWKFGLKNEMYWQYILCHLIENYALYKIMCLIHLCCYNSSSFQDNKIQFQADKKENY